MVSNNSKNSIPTDRKNFLQKLIDGDFGLAMTFWVYGILANFIIHTIMIVMLYIISSDSIFTGLIFFIFLIIASVYQISVVIGVWNASNRYQGSQLWSVLAKFYVILSILNLVFNLQNIMLMAFEVQ